MSRLVGEPHSRILQILHIKYVAFYQLSVQKTKEQQVGENSVGMYFNSGGFRKHPVGKCDVFYKDIHCNMD